MTKFQYFKFTFLAVGSGLTAGLLVWNLWELDVYSTDNIGQAALKSIFVGVFTALTLAVLNMFFKVTPFKQERAGNKSEDNN